MAETFVFGLVGAQDLNLGNGSFGPVTLPDGSTATLSKIGIHTFLGAAVVAPTDFAGADLGAQINAAIAALNSTYGGTLDLRGTTGAYTISTAITIDRPLRFLWGAGNYTFTAAPVLTAGMGFAWIGLGVTLTTFTWNTAGYLLDVAATMVIDQCEFADFYFTMGTTGTGFLKVGSTSQNFSASLMRLGWSFRNALIEGPTGGITSGQTGVSITQYLDWSWQNVTIKNFERIAVFDRGGNSTYDRVRFQSFRFGPRWSKKAGTGTITSGACLDTLDSCEFLGPVTTGVAGTGYGYTLDIDAESVTCLDCLYEPQPLTGKSQGMVRITQYGANFRDIGGVFSYDPATAALDNTIVCDNDYFSPRFDGTIVTIIGFPAISFGTPIAGYAAKAMFINCAPELNTLVVAQPLSKSIVIGQALTTTATTTATGSYVLRTASEIHDQEGILRIVGRTGYTQIVPAGASSGRGWETFYQDPTAGDQAITNVYDRANAVYKNWLIQAALTTFTYDVLMNQRLRLIVGTLTNNSATPSVAGGNVFYAGNSNPTTITNFTNGVAGQELKIIFTNGNTTINQGGNLLISGAGPFVGATDDTMCFICTDGSTWRETSRSVNN